MDPAAITTLLAASPAPTPTPAGTPSTLTTVLILALGSSVIAGALAHILTGLRAGATARRDRYATAVQLLVARTEYPYRVRRRTSDDPETLTTLTTTGHDLQERLAEVRAWISAESPPLSKVFDHCLTSLDTPFKQACADAWNAPPITTAAQMNLNGFGPGNQHHIITKMEHALVYRFGIRRLLPASLLLRILRRRGLLP
ncbi:hypothetical protein J7I98_22085 [Streptomyces sp. ISL-98]|uniref:hypothetical protein n=1 Tax=Streptomyces sp. ISL-98 TaxID=2819192 RepID=UPI001BE695EF|nr:hypothetical protein [Streptomyces sp. ISL-98]MBT2508528.1 hypothetical protein [Streptomyces sp. ISL-98]